MEYSNLPQIFKDMTELSMSNKDRKALATVSKSMSESSNQLTNNEYFQKRRLERLMSNFLNKDIIIENDANRTSTWSEKAVLVERAIEDISSDKICDLFRGDIVNAKIGTELLLTNLFGGIGTIAVHTAIMEASSKAAIYTIQALENIEDTSYWTEYAIMRDDPNIVVVCAKFSNNNSSNLKKAIRIASLKTIQVTLDNYSNGLDVNEPIQPYLLLEAASRGRGDVLNLLFNNYKFEEYINDDESADIHDIIFHLLRAHKGHDVPDRIFDYSFNYSFIAYISSGSTELAVNLVKKVHSNIQDSSRRKILIACVQALHNGYYKTVDAIRKVLLFNLSKRLFMYAITYGDVTVMQYLIDSNTLPKNNPDKVLQCQANIGSLRAISKLYCSYGRNSKTNKLDDWDLLCE